MDDSRNGSREAILGRIRQALKVASAEPELPAGTSVFAAVTDVVERFKAECAANLVECVVTHSQRESVEALSSTLASIPDGEVFVQDAPELRQLFGSGTGGAHHFLWSGETVVPETARASVTLAELLVAATGSIVVSSTCGGRRGSIVPPCHIVYATGAQVVADLEAALSALSGRGIATRNSFVGLITGSSRTADIEKILVLGAHGPRRVVVVLEISQGN